MYRIHTKMLTQGAQKLNDLRQNIRQGQDIRTVQEYLGALHRL